MTVKHFPGDGHEGCALPEPVKLRYRPGDQPLPRPASGPVMHDLVRADLLKLPVHRLGAALLADDMDKRKQLGITRYGQPLRAHNGRDAVRDAVDEAADLLVYLRQGIEEAAAAGDEVVRSQLAAVYHETLRQAARLAWVQEIRRARDER